MKNLLIDISPLAYRTLFANKEDFKMLGENILRHNLLGSIFYYIDRFKPNKVFVCFECDGKNWRKEKFDFYKAQRKEAREKQDVNWDEFYSFTSSFYNELKENFPFYVLKHDKLEADDIVSILVKKFLGNDNIMITNDGDYKQLLKYPGVKFFDSMKGIFNECDSPKKFLETKIIMGDRSDNIPPIRPRFGEKTAEKLIESEEIYKMLNEVDPDGQPCELKRNYDRNKLLIDLENTPRDLVESLENMVDEYQPPTSKYMVTYFRTKRLVEHLGNISKIRQNLESLVNEEAQLDFAF